jgi:ATP-dependent Clp protease ATP-binding subunit ClpA
VPHEQLGDRNISFALTAEAGAILLARGYSPAYGARPLRRLIEKVRTCS